MTKPQTRRRVAPGLWQLNTDLYEMRMRGICPHSGKMLSRWRRFQGSKLEAIAERDRLQAALKGGASEAPERETLEVFARSWLSTRLARDDWRETTAQRYAEALDLHILPRFGGAPALRWPTRNVSYRRALCSLPKSRNPGRPCCRSIPSTTPFSRFWTASASIRWTRSC